MDELLDWLHDHHYKIWLEYMDKLMEELVEYLECGGDTIENMLQLPEVEVKPRREILN